MRVQLVKKFFEPLTELRVPPLFEFASSGPNNIAGLRTTLARS